ncbi:MAG TPA: peptidoglycan editing factor PgeF [Symbiobacteriaceae bacterium]|nr:peptidoglycan editing factor PgeF [Symbiobacteriaceae bacterium]
MTPSARWQEHDGLEVLHISALESAGTVAAFFTGRRGGASTRWDGGLNWSYSTADDRGHVAENRRRTLGLLGLPLDRAVMAGLVHGDRVVAVTGAEAPGQDGVRVVPDCDGLITNEKGLALVVTAADCVPVYLYDPVRQAVGAVHAGWRGTVAGICGKAVAAMVQQYGSRPGEILAAIGPSIGPCCYEVDDAVAGPLRAYYKDRAELCLTGKPETPGKYMLDLWEANRQDLLGAGVTAVTIAGECTACAVQRLFSHRAEAGTAGRGAAVIALV